MTLPTASRFMQIFIEIAAPRISLEIE